MGYSPERKSAVLKRMLPPNNVAIRQLAQEEGISEATLHKWRAEARLKGQLMPDADAGPEGWSSRDKFVAVLETAALNEADLSEYCRENSSFQHNHFSGGLPLSSRNNRTSLRRRGCFLSQHPHAALTSDHRADVVEPTCSASGRQPANPMKAVDALSRWSLPSALYHAETRLCIFLPFHISFIANIARKRPELKRGKTRMGCISSSRDATCTHCPFQASLV